MILVTGAGGKTGEAIVGELVRRGAAVRAWLFRPKSTQATETVIGDMADPTLWQAALQECRKVYHICPNMSEDEERIGRNLLKAAQVHNIEHLVYHSVLHPQTDEMPHHWAKLRVENMILASGVPFTIVQPTAYMGKICLLFGQAFLMKVCIVCRIRPKRPSALLTYKTLQRLSPTYC